MSNPVTPNQNLVNPVKISPVGKPAGYYKSIIIDILGIGFALFFGYTYFIYLTVGASAWYVLVAFVLFGITTALQIFLQKNVARRSLVILGESVALIALFSRYDTTSLVGLIALIVFVVLLLGYMRSASESKNSMEISFFRATRSVLGSLVTALLLFMILVYAPQATGAGAFLPRQSFRTFFDWSAGFLNNFYPGLPFTGSFNNLSQSLAQQELQNNPTFGQMTVPQQNVAIEQAVSQLSGDVTQSTGVAPTPAEPTSDVVYNYIVSQLANWKSHLGSEFIIGWVIVVFLLLRTVGIVFVWLAQLMALIIYEIFLASGFMHIDESMQVKESIEY